MASLVSGQASNQAHRQPRPLQASPLAASRPNFWPASQRASGPASGEPAESHASKQVKHPAGGLASAPAGKLAVQDKARPQAGRARSQVWPCGMRGSVDGRFKVSCVHVHWTCLHSSSCVHRPPCCPTTPIQGPEREAPTGAVVLKGHERGKGGKRGGRERADCGVRRALRDQRPPGLVRAGPSEERGEKLFGPLGKLVLNLGGSKRDFARYRNPSFA